MSHWLTWLRATLATRLYLNAVSVVFFFFFFFFCLNHLISLKCFCEASGMHRNVLTRSWYLSGRFLFQASKNSLSVADSSCWPVSAWIPLQSIREVFPFSCHRGNHENNFLTPPSTTTTYPSIRVWVESAECKRQRCGLTLNMCYFPIMWNMSPTPPTQTH